jgi:signal transduction histidine kinase
VNGDLAALAQDAARARRDEQAIAEVSVLDRHGTLVAHDGHGGRSETVLDRAAASRASTAVGAERLETVRIPRADASGRSDPGLEITVPAFTEGNRERLGTIRLRLVTRQMRRQIRQTRLLLLGVAAAALGAGALGALLMARRITGPLDHLVSTTIRAAQGDLTARAEARGGDELGDLARTFNVMIGQIEANQRAVEEANRGLEQKVRVRTEDLEAANDALRKALDELRQAEAHLIHSEKMATLGGVVAGVAHEINTPAAAIGAAAYNVASDLQALARIVPALHESGVPAELRQRFESLVERALAPEAARRRPSTTEIRERARALQPRLARRGFGNPRELAVTFARLGLHEELLELVEDVGAGPGVHVDFLESVAGMAIAVNDIRLSVESVTRLVKALKGYSHPERPELVEADIHDGLETTLTILRNQIRYGVVVERRYARLPRVTCNVSELNQVWTNIIHNALQAMQGMGRITIETYARDVHAAVRITDTGPGIPAAIRSRIFEPFFTTKDQGEGTGLGLGICQQIVERHHGRILVDSEPGRTSFEILIPFSQPPEEARA